jgi:hypothetical protein
VELDILPLLPSSNLPLPLVWNKLGFSWSHFSVHFLPYFIKYYFPILINQNYKKPMMLLLIFVMRVRTLIIVIIIIITASLISKRNLIHSLGVPCKSTIQNR